MDKSRVLELLRPVVQSAQAPILRQYVPEAARVAAEGRGHGRMPLGVMRLAVDAAEELARVTWDSMREALDQTRLDWTETTHQELQAALEGLYASAKQALHQPFDRMGPAHASGVVAARDGLDKSAELHLRGSKALLELYVERRRREELVDVLTQLEGRLAAQENADLLGMVRTARQHAQASQTNDGQLKESLAVLSQALPAIVAANDLGQRLVEVGRWIVL